MEQRVRRMLKEAEQEHGRLLGAVRAVEADLEGPSATSTGNLARKLRTLADTFEAHCRAEEASQATSWIARTFPPLSGDLARLIEQHGPLIAALRDQSAACEAASDVELMSALAVRIRTIVAAVRQHEAAESTLLMQALELSAKTA